MRRVRGLLVEVSLPLRWEGERMVPSWAGGLRLVLGGWTVEFLSGDCWKVKLVQKRHTSENLIRLSLRWY